MNLASYIDHTILRQTTSVQEVVRVCEEALQYGFAAVCIPPVYVATARRILDQWYVDHPDSHSPLTNALPGLSIPATPEQVFSHRVKLATVIGFPMGYSEWGAKHLEIQYATEQGADELDMVVNISAIRQGHWDYLDQEIQSIMPLVRSLGKTIKVIIESGVLNDDEIIRCCEIYARAGVHFVKTSTGFAESGASVHAVKLLRRHLPPEVQVKASGGIRTFEYARQLVEAGANRLGCSASVAIIQGAGSGASNRY